MTRIKVGQKWLTRGGDIATITGHMPNEEPYQWDIKTDAGYHGSVTNAGTIWSDGDVDSDDLVELIEDVDGSVRGETMLLPTDPVERKSMPITTGVLDYFPLALAEVAKLSKVGNDQHNPGQPLHWDKSKSTDHADTIARHLTARGRRDTDGMRHSAKLAWRALALLQTEMEAEAAAK